MTEPYNYLGLMGGLQGLPDPLTAYQQGMAGAQGVRQNDNVLADQQLNTQIRQEQLRQYQIASDRQQQAQAEIDAALNSGHPLDYAHFLAKYPQLKDSLKAAHDAQTTDAQATDLGQIGAVYSLLKNGQVDRAKTLIQQRITADKNAGKDTTSLEAILEEAGTDPKRAANIAGLALSAIVPDKFSAIYEQLNKGNEAKVVGAGGALVGPDGKVIYEAPTSPTYREVDGKLVEIPGRTGSDQSSPAPAPSDLFSSMVGVESGGQQFDKSGKPLRSPKGAIGAAQLLPGTGPEAAQLAGLEWNPARLAMDRDYNIALGKAYFQKQLSDFGDPALAAAAYNAGPGRVRAAVKQGGDNWLAKLPQETQSYVARTVSSPSSSSPGPHVVFDSGPGYQLLTPQENQRLGLDPNVKYQRSRDGQITALGGQSKAQLKQIPTPAVTGIQENLSTLKKIDQAIDAVKGYPNAVGLGTGMLGDAFTQRHDPKGVPKIRSAIIQVENGAGGSSASTDGVRVVYDGNSGDGGDAPGDTTLQGEAYLSTLSPSLAAQVKALSEGRATIPTGAALRSPKVQQLFAAAAQYDPNLDQANAKTRQATRKEFTSGKSAANITSFNTVLGHLDSLDHAIDDLDNTSSPLYNGIANRLSVQMGRSKVTNFNTIKQAVKSELTRAFRGSSGNVADLKEFEGNLDASHSPDQLHEAVRQLVDLLGSRINALGEQYSAGMGRSTDGINLLDSKARKTYARLSGESGQQNAVPTITTPGAYAALASGSSYKDPQGNIRVKR